MADIVFPHSGQAFAQFLERIRRSPSSKIDVKWLQQNLEVSQASNAASTLRWLTQAGIVNAEGFLSDRGKASWAPQTHRATSRQLWRRSRV